MSIFLLSPSLDIDHRWHIPVDMVADLFLVIIPAYLLSDINLPRREKMLIIFLGLGNALTILAMGVSVFIIYEPFPQGLDSRTIVMGSRHMAVRSFNKTSDQLADSS